MARTLKGQKYTWQLSDEPIGSGDAGEVYAVVCKEQPDLAGMMKKPARIATGGTIQRQSGQIAQESLALARLEGLPACKAHPPQLLDEAPPYTQGTANYFIVSETASGLDIATLLTETRQAGKPFPRRVIITVIDALFDLFSRAHRAGVLWNDVKLDHIYWDNPTGDVTVIDWGNAQFLDQPEDNRRRILPRWEDYQQMVQTLGGFLKQNAPELYNDLGWEEFLEQKLDSPRVSVLARRIAYQQQVMSLKVMEYQSLIRVILSSDPTIKNLEKIREYQEILQPIGTSWEAEQVLAYCQKLVVDSLSNQDTQTAVKTVMIVWDLFDDNLELPWYLLREYFRDTEILTHPKIHNLAQFTLNEDWTNALWCLMEIARDSNTPDWWQRIMPVLRQKAADLVSPPPLQSAQSLKEWIEKEKPDQSPNLLDFSAIISDWRQKGADLENSPFEYEIIEFIQDGHPVPRDLRTEIKQSFASGQQVIRELSKAWANANFDGISTAVRQVAAWDPDRWGLIRLEDEITHFQSWLRDLNEGPSPDGDSIQFLEKMAVSRPTLENLLGLPAWLQHLINALNAIKKTDFLKQYRTEIMEWFPWMLQRALPAKLLNQAEVKSPGEVLTHFQKHLKNWSDIDAGLSFVNENAPEYYQICKSLIEGLQNTLMLHYRNALIPSPPQKQEHPALSESHQALKSLAAWRTHLADKAYDEAREVLSDASTQGWLIIEHADQTTKFWQQTVIPQLVFLRSGENPPDAAASDQNATILASVSKRYAEIYRIWDSIQNAGLHLPILETLDHQIEETRQSFMKWRQEQEQSTDEAVRVLYHSSLDQIRKIASHLLRLTTHSRQAKLSLLTFGEGFHTTVTVKLRKLANILEDLSVIESSLIHEPSDRHYPKWINDYSKLVNETTPEGRREVVLSLSANHPLYNLLIQSVFSN